MPSLRLLGSSFSRGGVLRQPRVLASRIPHVPAEGRRATAAKARVEHAWRRWQRVESWLKTEQVCVVDGANGTELQRRGGKPAETFSSGTSALARPDLCQEVHMAYLDSGADVLITHSYSSNRNVMTPSGNGDRVVECIMGAAAIARRATAAHVAEHASQLAGSAAASAMSAAQSVAAASTSAARATTSLATNIGAEASTHGALVASQLAADTARDLANAMQEAHCCAAAAQAAATAALAASEGDPIPPAHPPFQVPEYAPTPGWDAAGFGSALVVGSLSTHPPDFPVGGLCSADAKWPLPEVERENYMEAAQAHAASGVDMLWLEMMKDHDHAPLAVRAAAESGMPVFLGISARLDRSTGQLVLWGTGTDSVPLSAAWFHGLRGALGSSLVGVNVMHTNFSAMAPTLRFVREECGWTGPLGAYPDHGQFQAPDWIFAELNVEDAVEKVEKWIKDYDVQLVGGCCGLGPEYIKAVAAFVRRHNASVRSTSKPWPTAAKL